ncbi:hypothetical protein ACWDSJ_01675 [Nocardia sp. NPDC003482]
MCRRPTGPIISVRAEYRRGQWRHEEGQMGEKRRGGRPLRIDPNEFPERLGWPTRVLCAELNKLVRRADLTYKDIVRGTPGLDLDERRCSREMGEKRGGPSEEFFHAILTTAAAALDTPLEQLRETYAPLWENARNSLGSPRPETNPRVLPAEGVLPRPRPEYGPGVPAENSAKDRLIWLLTGLSDGEETTVAEQLPEVFGADERALALALTEAGRRLPGAVAALLDTIGARERDRRAALMRAITEHDDEVAERITAAAAFEAEPACILDVAPESLFGRRIVRIVQRGDCARASREVAAQLREPFGTDGSVLRGMIDSGPDGSASAIRLLTEMAEFRNEQMIACVSQFLRVQEKEKSRRLEEFVTALTAELRVTILLLLSRTTRIPNTHEPGIGFADLANFLRALHATPVKLASVLVGDDIIASEDLSAGFLVEAIPDFPATLTQMTSAEPGRTARLLVRALVDWEARAGAPEPPERYEPVRNLADTMLTMSDGGRLTGEILTRHPPSGTLVFHAMQLLDHPRFPPLLDALTRHVTVEAIADALISVDSGLRRGRILHGLRTAASDSGERLALTISARTLVPPGGSPTVSSAPGLPSNHTIRPPWLDSEGGTASEPQPVVVAPAAAERPGGLRKLLRRKPVQQTASSSHSAAPAPTPLKLPVLHERPAPDACLDTDEPTLPVYTPGRAAPAHGRPVHSDTLDADELAHTEPVLDARPTSVVVKRTVVRAAPPEAARSTALPDPHTAPQKPIPRPRFPRADAAGPGNG